MLYVVLFTDNTDHADARKRLMPAHLGFLEQHRDHIRAAGPLHEVADGTIYPSDVSYTITIRTTMGSGQDLITGAGLQPQLFSPSRYGHGESA